MIFGKIGDIIQRDSSVGHCFVLRDLIPMNFYETENMHYRQNFWLNLSKKDISRDPFFQYVVCNQGRDRVRHEGKGKKNFLVSGDIQQKDEVQNFGHK